MFRRETLIALHARRTAYRVAIDLLFPYLHVNETEVAPVHLEPEVPVNPHGREIEEFRHWLHIIVALSLLLAAIVALMILGAWPRP